MWPEAASALAEDVDGVLVAVLVVTGSFALLIVVLVARFAIKYRRRGEDEVPPATRANVRLEVLWILVPLLLSGFLFWLGASVYLDLAARPEAADPVYVVAKQWMWKLQHPEGPQEINRLHLARGRSVELVMTSQDVIHSFFVPAFRVKMDVVPGRYTRLGLTPTRTGRFHLFCAEYCGTGHSRMVGEVVVLEPKDFETWLEGDQGAPSPAARGADLFGRLGCAGCHPAGGGDRGPGLEGLFGKVVTGPDGRERMVDEDAIRRAIVAPPPREDDRYLAEMPSYAGQLSESEILDLVIYLKAKGSGGGR